MNFVGNLTSEWKELKITERKKCKCKEKKHYAEP